MILKKLKDKNWFNAVSVIPGFFVTSLDLILATVFINILALALPVFLMQVYDRIIGNAAWNTLTWFVIGCVVAVMFETVLRYIRALIGSWQAAKFEHLVNCDTIKTLLSADSAAFNKHPAGYYLDRINSVAALKAIYAGPVFQTFMDIPFALLFFAGIWFLGRNLVFVPFVAIAAFLLLMLVIRFVFVRLRERQIMWDDSRLSFLIEILSGIYTVKSLALEEHMLRRYEYLQQNGSDAGMKLGFWSKLPVALGSFFTQIAMFGVILIGARFVMNDEMTFGSLAACTMLVGRGMQPILSAATFMIQIASGKFALAKLHEVSDIISPRPKDSIRFNEDISGSVDIENMSFGYSSSQAVFKDINLNLNPGQFCFISGKNGSGRSTLMKLIFGIYRPDSGRILIDGFKVFDCDRAYLRGRVEYISDNGVLFQGTIIENITLFDNTYISEALGAAALVGLDDLVAKLSHGYETMINSKSNNTLPKGLIQRICIARALVKRPRVLILDKVYQAMDADTSSMFFDLLYRLKGTCTVIFCGSSPLFESLADISLELKNGSLVIK